MFVLVMVVGMLSGKPLVGSLFLYQYFLLKTEEANMRRLFLVMRTPKVLHQMRLLPESVQAKDAFVGSDTGMRTQMHIDIRLGAQNHRFTS